MLEVDPEHVDSYELRIGRVATTFELLHNVVERFAWNTWGLNEEAGLVITKDLPTKHLVEKLKATLELPSAERPLDPRLKALLKMVDELSEERNKLMHSAWDFRQSPAVLKCRKLKAKNQSINLDLNGLERLIDRIEDTTLKIFDFAQDQRILKEV